MWRRNELWRAATLMVAAVALAGCDGGSPPPAGGPKPATAPRVTTRPGGDFTAMGAGPTLRGEVEADITPPLRQRWTYEAGDRASFVGSVIVGDAVYGADDRDMLHAVGLVDGKRRWTFEAKGPFRTTPLAIAGMIIAGDDFGVLYALDATTGAVRWTFTGEATWIHSAAVSDGKRIFFGNDLGVLHCLTLEGKELWSAKTGAQINAAVSVGEGCVYVGSCSAKLRAYAVEDGRELASADILAGSSAVVDGDAVIVGTYDGRVLCLDGATLATRWTYQIERGETEAVVYSTPAIAGGPGAMVIVGGQDRAVHAIDRASGKRRWVFRAREDFAAPVVIARTSGQTEAPAGVVYIGCRDNHFYAVDLATGRQLQDIAAARPIVAPAAVGRGVVVFADQSGLMYCLEPAQ